MTDKKWTKDDVVVGATIHVRITATFTGPAKTVTNAAGVVCSHNSLKTRALITSDGVDYSAPLVDEFGHTVEILDVQPPARSYVVGGIYRVTVTDLRWGPGPVKERTHLYRRLPDGWTTDLLGSGRIRSLADSPTEYTYVVGDRVLVIDYPSDGQVERLTSDFDFPWAKGSLSDLVARALKAEAR